MIKLDETKSYYLGDLSYKQKDVLLKYLQKEEPSDCWTYFISNTKYLYYDNKWLESHNKSHNRVEVNALELFYTLENIQVDCIKLSEEQIEKMYETYLNNNKEPYQSKKFALNRGFDSDYFICNESCFYITNKQKNKHTITYDKFMELFSKEEKPTFCEEVKQGYKEKDNKLSYELDFEFIEAMTKRIENEPKYPPYNWKKPIDINDLANALFRHAIEIKKGNLNDNGDLGHLIAVANNAMFMYYQLKNNEQSTK